MRAEMGIATQNNTLGPTSTHSGAVTLFKFISLGLIIAFGSAGNALVIYAFGRHLRLRRSPYQLMVSFVCLDLMRVFLCFPVTFITVVHRLQWKYGAELCQLMAFTNVFCLLGNSLSVFGMALDRYVDNKYRAFYRRKFRGFHGTAMLLVVWGMAFLFAFPIEYGVRSQQYLLVEAQCTYPHHYYPNDIDTLGLMISLTIIVFLTNAVYLRLFLFLRQRRRMRPVIFEPAVSDSWSFFEPGARVSVRRQWLATSISESSAPISVIGRNGLSHQRPTSYEIAAWRNGRQKNNEKLTKLCFAINVIFSLMWLPYIVVCFWFALEFGKPKYGVPEWLEVSATWLTYLQVAVTPLAFFSLSAFTRRSFLGKRRCSPTLSNSSNE